MKCIQSIKPTKHIEVGVVKRVDNVEAESMVKSSYWKYVPKSEWKKQTRIETVNNQVINSVTIKNKHKKSKQDK